MLTPTLRPLLKSSGALVMLPSLLSSMYARDTACAQRFSYCRYGFVLRKRDALLRCRPIDRKRRRRKSCAADHYRSGQSYLAHVRLSFEDETIGTDKGGVAGLRFHDQSTLD